MYSFLKYKLHHFLMILQRIINKSYPKIRARSRQKPESEVIQASARGNEGTFRKGCGSCWSLIFVHAIFAVDVKMLLKFRFGGIRMSPNLTLTIAYVDEEICYHLKRCAFNSSVACFLIQYASLWFKFISFQWVNLQFSCVAVAFIRW